MKTRVLFFFIILSFLFINNASALSSGKRSIRVNTKERLLTAPSGSFYQWYYNDCPLLLTSKNIKILAPGTYKVIVTNENGEKETLSAIITNQENETRKIYILGDSTACNWAAGYYPQSGWGQMLGHFFNSSVIIDNRAISARSAKSFYNDHWAPIKNALMPGDFVFIQFGINDAKKEDPLRYTDPFTTFQEYLTLFVNESRAKGAYPVLLTTGRRNRWNATIPPTLYDSYHDYPVATRQLAPKLNVPLIDLDQTAKTLLEGLGPEYVGPFMYMILDTAEYPVYPTGKYDEVHFQENGAIEMARLVTKAISEFDEDTIMNKLIPFIKPQYPITVTKNLPDGAILTRNASYPEGIPVTIKAKLDPAYDLIEWQDSLGNPVCKTDRYTFTMGNKPLSLTAILDDDPVADCSGEYNGSAYIDNCGDCVEGTTGMFPCCTDIKNGTYNVTCVSSGWCTQPVTIDGEEIQYVALKNCSENNSQTWLFTRGDDNYSIMKYNSGLYLGASNVSPGEIISVNQTEMKWRIEQNGKDTFLLVPDNKRNCVLDLYTLDNESFLSLSLRKNTITQKFKITIDSSFSSLKESNDDGSFSIYPNPFSNELTIKQKEKNDFLFSLYDMNGLELYNAFVESNSKLFVGDKISEGLYIAKVSQGENTWFYKVVKK